MLIKKEAESVFNKKFETDFQVENFKLDFYSEELKIGIEYSGKEHYIFPNNIFKNTNEGREKFINQRKHFEDKLNFCDGKGIYLITIPYTVKEENIKAWIKYYRPNKYYKSQL